MKALSFFLNPSKPPFAKGGIFLNRIRRLFSLLVFYEGSFSYFRSSVLNEKKYPLGVNKIFLRKVLIIMRV